MNRIIYRWGALICAMMPLGAGRTLAQSFTTVHEFMPPSALPGTNSDGTSPTGLIVDGNTLYGTTQGGGTSGQGTVFKINADGTGFTTIYNFKVGNGGDNYSRGGLALSGKTLYGTTGASQNGAGTVFAVNVDETGFANLHTFVGTDGGDPRGGLIASDDRLYGTTSWGGSLRGGTVFAMRTDGSGFKILHEFAYDDPDQAGPEGELLLSGSALYGTTGRGTIFAMDTDGSGFRVLHKFAGGTDGIDPSGRLLLIGNTLFGTTYRGGDPTNSPGNGTVFSIKTDGTEFKILHTFTETQNQMPPDSEGAHPFGALVSAGNQLFGLSDGGAWGTGTIFSLNADGSGFRTIYGFGGFARFRWGRA